MSKYIDDSTSITPKTYESIELVRIKVYAMGVPILIVKSLSYIG
jgi:hypothetical protein